MLNKIKQKLGNFYYIHIAKSVDRETVLRIIIDAELKKYGVNMQYVTDHPDINGERWYYYYTFDSEKEFNKWKKFSNKMLKKAFPYADKFILDREFSMLNLMWGLRTSYENENSKSSK